MKTRKSIMPGDRGGDLKKAKGKGKAAAGRDSTARLLTTTVPAAAIDTAVAACEIDDHNHHASPSGDDVKKMVTHPENRAVLSSFPYFGVFSTLPKPTQQNLSRLLGRDATIKELGKAQRIFQADATPGKEAYGKYLEQLINSNWKTVQINDRYCQLPSSKI